MPETVVIGSRGSALALAQTHWVSLQLAARFPGLNIQVRIIRTAADQDTRTSIRSSAFTGVFVKELEDALLRREIDLAVHSLKDLPTRLPEALSIIAIPAREDPRDALITKGMARTLAGLAPGCRVGTGSARRQAQLLAARPDLRIMEIRGNVDTRIAKLEAGEYDAILLACAGLRRLGLMDGVGVPLTIEDMLPAAGQGALGLEGRRDDHRLGSYLHPLHDPAAAAAVTAERAFIHRMGGGCSSPIAVHAIVEGPRLDIHGLVATPDGSAWIRERHDGVARHPEEEAALLAEKMLSRGAGEILRRAGDGVPS